MTMWDDVKKNLLGWYDTASDKTGEMARIGLKRYDIFGISRDIERQFSEIGSLVYTAIKEGRADILEDTGLLTIVARLKVLEAELAAKENEISDIRAAKQAASEMADQEVSEAETASSSEVENIDPEAVEIDSKPDPDPGSERSKAPESGD